MKDVLNSIKWPAALVICGAMALLGFMFWRGATLEALGTFLILLLGYQTQQRTKDSETLQRVEGQTNGVNHGLQQQLRQLQAERAQDLRIMAALASRVPIGTPLPPALEQAGSLPADIPIELVPAGYTSNNGMTVPLPRESSEGP